MLRHIPNVISTSPSFTLVVDCLKISLKDEKLHSSLLVVYCHIQSLPLLLPAVEDSIFNDIWRIRQSFVEILGDLLFKVAGTSGKALLEGGSNKKGATVRVSKDRVV